MKRKDVKVGRGHRSWPEDRETESEREKTELNLNGKREKLANFVPHLNQNFLINIDRYEKNCTEGKKKKLNSGGDE